MSPPRLTIDEYQRRAARTDITGESNGIPLLMLGLFGEAGSVLSEVKKTSRDLRQPRDSIQRSIEEIGDLLWYIAVIAHRYGVALSDVVAPIAISNTIQNSAEPLTFRHLQEPTKTIPLRPDRRLELTLLHLADAVGHLVYSYRDRRGEAADPLIFALQNVVQELVAVSVRSGITLEQVAEFNLAKTQSRWPSRRRKTKFFDDKYPTYERLSRNFEVSIFEEVINGSYFVYQKCNGINIGDRLTDNIADPDEYRFHDVFHYAYSAVLGWSPVLRSLFKTKRKSDRRVDEAEDGARAILIEEGISALVFNYAKNNHFLAGIEPGRLSFDVLKTIRNFVRGYEVERCPYWMWEDAILQGYRAFRFLQKERKGTIIVANRSLSIRNFEA